MRSISGVFLVALLALTAVGQAGASVRDSLALRITQVDLTRFPYVQLKVEVRRNGLLQHTLNSPDFSIREDGIAQFVESLACPGDSLTRLSVAILLDRSGSMATDDDGGPDPDSVKLRAAKAATSTFLSFLESRDEACMYSFASSFAANQSFTNDTARLRGALVPISAYGSTAIWESMLRTLDSLRARAGRRVMICLTDGRSQKEDPRRFTYSKVIDKAVLERVPVYIIGLGSDVDENTLTSIANSTGGKYYTSPGPADLEAIFGRIADDIITDACVLRYTSTNPCLDGSMRLVEVNVRIGNLVASAETSYTVVNKLSPMTLFFESGLQAQSRTEFRLPLTVLEPLSTISPLSFTVLLRFDSTLLALRSVETAGTITQGGTLQLQRIDAGGCRISITDYIPVLPSGPLFQLVFSAAGTPVDTITRVVILDAGMQQQCPVTLDARGTAVTLLACSQAYTIGSAETVVASPGGGLRVPIRVAPALNAGEAFNAHFSVAYDSALVQFSGVEAARPYETGASLVATRIKGSLIVDVRGRPADSTDVLCWLLFRQNNLRESTTASLRLAALAVTTECAVDAASQDPVLLLDGYCERLLTRSASRPTVSAHPNPFNPSTTLEFSIPSDGDATLRIIDVAGREVALLHRGPIASGRYRLPFDARGLPSGSYRVVLTHAGRTAAHSIMFVK